ncbi:5-bromo-4-chloroindolyl phosphate hydrolysis family protein [Carnobacterium funditum]|uniref:5-bromo-4-chloroindolyl phosphate hydrolysis family protein n=1 Tax=Carnobacterium funditum TaxID=2752 RepID=UPI00068FC150|nr:5-bromo-4-chloroindolyl phosphate hydrolysis family protein [Carnobacterium funditum]
MNDFSKNVIDVLRYAFISVSTILMFLLLAFIFDLGFWWSLIISIAIGSILFYMQNENKTSQSHGKLKKVSVQKENFYKSNGLNKEEMNFFRETMYVAKMQILTLEKNMQFVSKLSAIEKRNNTVHLAKSLFKEITENPRRLNEANKFLYVHLSSLVDLTNKYIEIDQHEVKSKATYDVLNESAATIDEMCHLIAVDYVAFKSGDFDDMSIEVELAKKAIERDNAAFEEIENQEL